jgi:hypothetical protein
MLRAARRFGLARRFHMPFDALDLGHDAVAGLMRLWSRIHWSSGDGMMPPDQLLAIYRLAVEWPAPGDVVELGAWTGLTTAYLATACRVRRHGRVFAVDTFEGTREGGAPYPSIARMGGSTLDAFQARMRRAGIDDVVKPLIGMTTHVVDRYPGGPVRFLLIDADHSYDGVRGDFERWSPKVAPGGLIVFHDYQMPDVARFVNACVMDRPGFAAHPGPVVPNVIAFTKTAHVEASLPRRFVDPVVEAQRPVEVGAS